MGEIAKSLAKRTSRGRLGICKSSPIKVLTLAGHQGSTKKTPQSISATIKDGPYFAYRPSLTGLLEWNHGSQGPTSGTEEKLEWPSRKEKKRLGEHDILWVSQSFHILGFF